MKARRKTLILASVLAASVAVGMAVMTIQDDPGIKPAYIPSDLSEVFLEMNGVNPGQRLLYHN